ncbi:MAG: hypothetical protein ACTHJ9_13815 [Rhodanobacter sp.]
MTPMQMIAQIDHLAAEVNELRILTEDMRREKEQALYQLQVMRGNGVLDLNKLERTIKGDQR